MNNDLLIEALEIAINNYDYDGEYEKADTIRAYIADTQKEMARLQDFMEGANNG